ncbi:MAG TPA: DUF418 domain-containing protein [Steroidobacter sp.]
MTAAIASERINTLDAIRGAAVLGILLMNIVDLAMPGWAYYDPYYYGGSEGVNFATWAINYALFDGKMRGLFTMMFGASTVLIAERALKSGESPARIHYARMFWLLVFGMIHVWFIWYGDILVLYAIAGMIAFVAWRWSVRTLITTGIVLLTLKLILAVWTYTGLRNLQEAASAPNAPAEVQQEWHTTLDDMTFFPPQTQLDGYRGSYIDAFKARAPVTMYILTQAHPLAMTDTLALIAFGMALFRLGFFSGAWSTQTYRRIALRGFAICVPLHIPLILWNDADRFSLVTLHITEAIHLTLLRPWLVLSHASLVVLFMQSGAARWFADRLIAVGRMAFSNYIAMSVICVLLFHGYGLGLYGVLERWQCYLIVPLIWAALLLWSKPWLERHAYGPLEWLWRALTRGRRSITVQPVLDPRS